MVCAVCRAAERLARHHAFSNIASHGFSSAGFPTISEPPGISRDDFNNFIVKMQPKDTSADQQHDLAKLWDQHCEYEFVTRDVHATMSTMVCEPYVNHIPTMTGGVGAKELTRFYEHHFINNNPDDLKMIPVSRVVGTDRVVDEMVCCFTHDREIDWMLPGIAPTGKFVKIPLVAIVTFRDGKLCNEHIYWDQASVLLQIGLLNSTNLPIAGVETADKLLDKNLPSNTLMKRWCESASK